MVSRAVLSNLGTQLHINVNLNALCEYRTVKVFELTHVQRATNLTCIETMNSLYYTMFGDILDGL